MRIRAQELRKKPQRKKTICGMTFCECIPFNFSGSGPLAHISWIFTAIRPDWPLSWTALSTMRVKVRSRMQSEPITFKG